MLRLCINLGGIHADFTLPKGKEPRRGATATSGVVRLAPGVDGVVALTPVRCFVGTHW